MRRVFTCALALSAVVGATIAPGGASAKGQQQSYVVLSEAGASQKATAKAIEAAGGKVTGANAAIGVTYASAANTDFVTDVSASGAVEGAAHNKPIGYATPDLRPKADDVEALSKAAAGAADPGVDAAPAGDPFSAQQWDMQMIHANADGSLAASPGPSASWWASWTPASTAATRTSRRTSTAR